MVEQEQARGLGQPQVTAPRAATWFVGALAAPLCAAAWMLWTRPHVPAPPPRPAPLAPEPSHLAGFEGVLDWGDGTRLAVLLHPLHAGDDLQAFDARVLRDKLGLTAGEPWRLTLVRSAAAPRAQPRRLEVRAPRVVDSGGACLSLPELSAPDATAPADPLRTLLASLEGELPPASSRTGIVWGRPPREAVRLELERAVPLSPRDLASSERETSWARAALAPASEER